MLRVGLFYSEYTEATCCFLEKLLKPVEYELVRIYMEAAHPEPVDILIINRPPVSGTAQFLCGTAIMNTDDKQLLRLLKNTNARIVTYGFNSKASVTASSVLDGRVLCCVQRSMQTHSGENIIEQEFSVSTAVLTKLPKIFSHLYDTGIEISDDIIYNIDYQQIIINCLLPAVAAALTAGVPVGSISNTDLDRRFLLSKKPN